VEVDANAGGIIDAFIGQPAENGGSTGTTFVHVGGGTITVTSVDGARFEVLLPLRIPEGVT